MTHLKTFAMSEGRRYQDLVPNANLVTPSQTHEVSGNLGWAYCARTPERDLFMVYFEQGCPVGTLRGCRHRGVYATCWFDPRTGEWTQVGELEANDLCEIKLPDAPSDEDWALKLVLLDRKSP